MDDFIIIVNGIKTNAKTIIAEGCGKSRSIEALLALQKKIKNDEGFTPPLYQLRPKKERPKPPKKQRKKRCKKKAQGKCPKKKWKK